MNADMLRASMQEKFPIQYMQYISVLAPIMAAMYRGEIQRADIESVITEDGYPFSLDELESLLGINYHTNTMLSFGSQGNVGDVNIQGVAGNNIIHNYYPPADKESPEEKEKAHKEKQEQADKLFSKATQLHIMGDYWNALGLFEQVREINPLYPQVRERINLVQTQIYKFHSPTTSSADPNATIFTLSIQRRRKWIPILLVLDIILGLILYFLIFGWPW